MADIRPHLVESLERLNTGYLDVYFLHYPVSNDVVHIRDRMATMMKLKEEGLIRAIGISNFTIEQTKEALEYGVIDVAQPCFNLVWRWEEDYIKYCKENNIGVVTYSSVAQGLLSGGYSKDKRPNDARIGATMFRTDNGNYDKSLSMLALLTEISAKYGRTPAQGAIKWLQQFPGVTAPIVGAYNEQQARENASASDWEFSQEDFDALDNLSLEIKNSMEYPNATFQAWTSPEPNPFRAAN